MILSKVVEVTISNNGKYYAAKGYGPLKQRDRIVVKLEDMPANSNHRVVCLCDECETTFERQLQLLNRTKEHLCKKCSSQRVFRIRDYTRIKEVAASKIGPMHPRFNPNKPAFKEYQRKVFSITRKNDLSVLENFDKPRGLCGVGGAYQLDHIISTKYGFENNIEPEVLGDISNLRFIPWEENRKKWASCS